MLKRVQHDKYEEHRYSEPCPEQCHPELVSGSISVSRDVSESKKL